MAKQRQAPATPREIDSFLIQAQLPTGGMGTVYRAVHPVSKRIVALKLAHDRYYWALRAEAELLQRLDHPNIVKILPIHGNDQNDQTDGSTGGQQSRYVRKTYIDGEPRCYMVMEYLDGGSLGDQMRQGQTLPAWLILRVVERVSAALDYVHSQGIVHLDVKPSNILLSRNGRRVVLTDFGIARPAQGGDRQLTFGAVPYVSPEQLQGPGVGPRSDVYSLGVVVYEMCTGRLPYEGSPTAVARDIQTTDPVRPRQRRPELPAAVEDVILQAMARSPEMRYPSARALAAALRRAIRWRDGGNQRWLPIAAAALGVGAIVLVVALSLGGPPPPPPPTVTARADPGEEAPAAPPAAEAPAEATKAASTPTRPSVTDVVYLSPSPTPKAPGATSGPAPTSTLEPTRQPTQVATLTPTRTPTVGGSPTPRQVTLTPAPTPAHESPVLTGVRSEPGLLLLTWSYAGQLAADEWFDVIYWPVETPRGDGKANVKETFYRVGGSFAPGEYNWTIAVIRKRDGRVERLAEAGKTMQFKWP